MTTATMTAPPAALPLDQITPSPNNPRKTFDQAELDELTDSVRKLGVLQPVLVRPKGKRFELVAGERRYRAAKAAGLDEIPVVVRELDDAAAAEVMVVENLHRSDLHPLEEAEGYELLMKQHGYTADDLVVKIGRSKSYIYGRLKLCELVAAGKKALLAGKLTHSVALLVARLPHQKLQQEALKDLTAQWRDEPASFRETSREIQRRFMTRLKDAPFPTRDAELLKKAGPCTTCPKRTGNQPELFDDVESADVCTDPSCFAEKKDAWWDVRKTKAEASGQKVLSDRETKKLFPFGGHLAYNAPLIDLSDRCHEHGARGKTFRALLGKDKPESKLCRDPDGNVRELVDRKAAHRVLRKKYSWASKSNRSDSRQSASVRKEQEKRKLQKAVAREACAQVADAGQAKAPKDQTALWRVIAGALVRESLHEGLKEIAARRELGGNGRGRGKRQGYGDRPDDLLLKEISKPGLSGLRGFVAELVTASASFGYGRGPSLKDTCAAFGVDLAPIERSQRATLKPKPKKAPARKKGARRKKVAARKKDAKKKRVRRKAS